MLCVITLLFCPKSKMTLIFLSDFTWPSVIQLPDSSVPCLLLPGSSNIIRSDASGHHPHFFVRRHSHRYLGETCANFVDKSMMIRLLSHKCIGLLFFHSNEVLSPFSSMKHSSPWDLIVWYLLINN